ETLPLLWRAILRANVPATSDSLDISALLHRSCRRPPARAWSRSSDRGDKQLGPNPYLSPFTVFGPLTCCLIFGVHSNRNRSPLSPTSPLLAPQHASATANTRSSCCPN